jgi:hypothetical protein
VPVLGTVGERLAEWMASDLSKGDLLVIQIDGCISGTTWCWSPPLGIDGKGHILSP